MRFAVIGNPVAHSLSPAMHSAAYRALSLEHEYVKVQIEDIAAEIGTILEFDGVNVTVPHKETILKFCDPDDFARRAGSANTLKRGSGINTDGSGFLDILPEEVETVLILGAGGTARSIALALVMAGKRVTVWNRTQERAIRLVNDLDIRAEVSSHLDLRGQEAIVNATSTGLTGDSLPIEWDQADTGAIAYEVAYGTVSTDFELAAERAGLKSVGGRELLIAQGARSFEWWLGIPAPIEAMRSAVYGKGETSREI